MPETPAPPSRFTLEQRLALYNAAIVTTGAVLAAIAWFPNFEGKQQELSAFALIKDNPAGVLTVRDLGPADGTRHRYDISYTLLLKNTSNSRFDVAWSLDQLFLADQAGTTGDPAPAVVNDPPNVWDPPAPGALRWREIHYDLSFDDDHPDPAAVPFFGERKKSQTAAGGGMTGPFVPGHVSGHSAHYIVVADPAAYVNVTITYGMSQAGTLWQRLTGKVPSSLYDGANLVGETVRLGDADQPGCRLGIAVQNSQISSACGANPL